MKFLPLLTLLVGLNAHAFEFHHNGQHFHADEVTCSKEDSGSYIDVIYKLHLDFHNMSFSYNIYAVGASVAPIYGDITLAKASRRSGVLLDLELRAEDGTLIKAEMKEDRRLRLVKKEGPSAGQFENTLRYCRGLQRH